MGKQKFFNPSFLTIPSTLPHSQTLNIFLTCSITTLRIHNLLNYKCYILTVSYMKKILWLSIITLIIITLMIAQTVPSVRIISQHSSIVNNQTVEWSDGSVSGTWMDSEHIEHGSIQGILTMGRSEKTGWFLGIITNEDNLPVGQFSGRFFRSILLGIIQLDDTDIPYTPFLGTITTSNNTWFSATIKLLAMYTITITCTYQFSFLPRPTGPYFICVKDQYLIDTSRVEKFTQDEFDHREMMLKIWYPIEPKSAEDPVEYMDYFTFQWLKNRSPIPLITIKNDAYLSINPHGFNQGILLTNQETFPILVFSPGYDGNVEIYTSFIEEMVSHGYVVFSINHPFISGLTIFPDGRMIRSTSIESFSFESVVEDVLFVLNYLEDLNENDPIFKNRLDLDHIGMYGHSFGGAATLEVMKRDSRVKAGLTLDGAIGADLIPDSFDKPFMMMLAEESFAENASNQLFNRIKDDGYLLTILGSTHYAFTDVGLLMSHLIPLIPSNLLLFGTINAKRMVNITRSYIREFFDVYLKNEPLDHIFDLENKYNEAILVKK